MNTSFEPLRIVNTYGAFGSITKERRELIIQATVSDEPESPNTVWEDYEFKCKPGNISSTPCLIAPYHQRLDWLMWFAAFGKAEQNPWIYKLVAHLIVNDPHVSTLLARNHFIDEGEDPLFIRIMSYKYKFTEWDSPESARGEWWKREDGRIWMQPMSKKMLKPMFEANRWRWPQEH